MIHTLREGTSLDIQTIFSKSREEQLEALRVEIEQYKINSGDKINIEFLSPASRERKLKEIDLDLTNYYAEHRGSTQLDADKRAAWEKRRFASALGVHNMDVNNLAQAQQEELLAYLNQRTEYLEQAPVYTEDTEDTVDTHNTHNLKHNDCFEFMNVNQVA